MQHSTEPARSCQAAPEHFPGAAQDLFVRAYLEVALGQQPGRSLLASAAGEAALEEAARKLVAAANAYVPVSHLLWGLWGLIQARTIAAPSGFLRVSAHVQLPASA